MTDNSALPCSWSEWMDSLGESKNAKVHGSATILREARKFADTCGISVEAAVSQLLWLGSTSMLNHVHINWPSGMWQPSGIQVAAVEDDGVPIDQITNTVIGIANRLGLDPIQDTVKEGPAGLISRLERKPARWVEQVGNLMDQGLEAIINGESATEADLEKDQVNGVVNGKALTTLQKLGNLDTSQLGEAEVSNVSNARGLIYPSGRAFLSYLYDTSFFNALDELIQHGNYHVRGKLEVHRLREMNLCLFTAFYQGALANLIQDSKVQGNLVMLLRQALVMWRTDGQGQTGPTGRVSTAVGAIEELAGFGLEFLEGLSAPALDAPTLLKRDTTSYFESDVGIRFSNVNRQERLIRVAIGVAFWRIADGDMNIEITEGDCAVADSILHCHDMGSRLLEIAASRGKAGTEAMRIFSLLIDGETLSAESISMASSVRLGEETLNTLSYLSILDDTGKLQEEYRIVSAPTQEKHKARWGI